MVEDSSKQIHNIINGVTLVYYEKNENEQIPVVVGLPSMRILHMAGEVFDRNYEMAIGDDMLSEEDILNKLEQDGIFNREEDEEIIKAEKGLEDIDKLIGKLQESPRKEEYKQGYLAKKDRLKEKLADLKKRRHSLSFCSAEHHANTAKMQFMLPFCIYNIDGDRFWDSCEKFNDEDDTYFVAWCLGEFATFYNECSQYELRKLSRDSEWRGRWRTSCKTGAKIFKIDHMSEWNNQQVNLCFWSNFYDSIYESYNRPPDWVIDNNRLLDKWVEEENKKDEGERSTKYTGLDKGVDPGKDTGQPDVFVFENKELHFKEYGEKDDIRQFNKMNKELDIPLRQDLITGKMKENG